MKQYTALDQYFGNVCELDVIFNFERVHTVIDEIMMAGEIQETSLKEIKRVYTALIYLSKSIADGTFDSLTYKLS